MLGWEFPPFFAGGAGMVCKELSEALNNLGVQVTFIMPHGPDEEELQMVNSKKSLLKIKVANNSTKELKIKQIYSLLKPYGSFEQYSKELKKLLKNPAKELYGKDLKSEVERFSYLVLEAAKDEEFDVIHAHDWVTFLAGVRLKEMTGKPLVIHVHITEFDKTGGDHADPYIYSIEKLGIERADRVICVSNKVKQRCEISYYADPSKLRVVHNAAITMDEKVYDWQEIKQNKKMVLFAGRITLQKGPEYFVDAAKLVLEKEPNTLFCVAGTGDMLPKMIEKTKQLGIHKNFYFHGFYTRQEAEKIFGAADVFVMPSVSEPFGIVPFEAQIKKTPTIISKQSGISEILEHTLQVDFWDVKEMANKIIGLLHYEPLHKEISVQGHLEAKNSTWIKPAQQCINIYEEVIQ